MNRYGHEVTVHFSSALVLRAFFQCLNNQSEVRLHGNACRNVCKESVTIAQEFLAFSKFELFAEGPY